MSLGTAAGGARSTDRRIFVTINLFAEDCGFNVNFQALRVNETRIAENDNVRQ